MAVMGKGLKVSVMDGWMKAESVCHGWVDEG